MVSFIFYRVSMWRKWLSMLWMVNGNNLDLSFHVPISNDSKEGIPLSVRETLAVFNSLITLSTTVDCKSPMAVAEYTGSFNGTDRNPALSYFKSSGRPEWMTGPSPAQTWVCLDGKRIGHVEYYSVPILHHQPPERSTVNVRLFVNPGWMNELGKGIPCSGCNISIHSVALKEPVRGQNACAGHREENNFLLRFQNDGDDDGDHINIFPFKFRLVGGSDQNQDVPFIIETDNPMDDPDTYLHTYTVSSDKVSMYTINGQEHGDVIFGKTVHWCFYTDVHADSGLYLGDVVFVLSENDTSGLVIFILFFMVAFPIIAMITAALYCYRLKQQRQWVLSVKYFIQRLQLEQELSLRHRARRGLLGDADSA
jgi:hypothetical protein